MNGIHDMGGMHGMGPIRYEKNEPVFHEQWEGRVYAINRAIGAWKKWNIDAGRHGIELLPPADYLRMSYYEKWFAGLATLLVESRLVTGDELANGRAAPGTAKSTPPLRADRVAAALANGGPTERAVVDAPRFMVGMTVRARTMNPLDHTRLPRYVRGRLGTISRHHGAHVFPDSNAHGLGEQPQHLYQVRFEARELWGETGSGAIYIDLWEPYLEPG
jgi:nitrile hydratase